MRKVVMAVLVVMGVLFCPLTSWATELPFNGMFYLDEGNNVVVMDQKGDIYRLDWQTSHVKIVGAAQGTYVFAQRQNPLLIDAFPKTGYKGQNYGRFPTDVLGKLLGVTPSGRSVIFSNWSSEEYIIGSFVMEGATIQFPLHTFLTIPKLNWAPVAISFSADQNYFFFLTDQWVGRLHETATKVPLQILNRKTIFDRPTSTWYEFVRAGAFHPTNPKVLAWITERYLFAGSEVVPQLTHLRTKDFQTGEELSWQLPRPARGVSQYEMSWTPDGHYIAWSEDQLIYLFNLQTGQSNQLVGYAHCPVCY